jgi:hypothetical protein
VDLPGKTPFLVLVENKLMAVFQDHGKKVLPNTCQGKAGKELYYQHHQPFVFKKCLMKKVA